MTENSLIDRASVNELIVRTFGPGFLDAPYIWDVGGEVTARPAIE